jgi:prefoldin subunit 5
MNDKEIALKILDDNVDNLSRLAKEIGYNVVYIRYMQNGNKPITAPLVERLIRWNKGEKFVKKIPTHSQQKPLLRKIERMHLKNQSLGQEIVCLRRRIFRLEKTEIKYKRLIKIVSGLKGEVTCLEKEY